MVCPSTLLQELVHSTANYFTSNWSPETFTFHLQFESTSHKPTVLLHRRRISGNFTAFAKCKCLSFTFAPSERRARLRANNKTPPTTACAATSASRCGGCRKQRRRHSAAEKTDCVCVARYHLASLVRRQRSPECVGALPSPTDATEVPAEFYKLGPMCVRDNGHPTCAVSKHCDTKKMLRRWPGSGGLFLSSAFQST